jgi:hypothetical protein
MPEIQKVNINKVKSNPGNPRLIKDDKFFKLVKSIQEFPQMLDIRPIVVNDDMIVLGGNMRLKACKEAGIKEVSIIMASDLTEQQQREFIIKDNVGFGEWDWEDLANNWDIDKLTQWGLDIPNIDEIKETSDISDQGQLEFSDELLLEHNYIVLYFDNPLDWEVAKNLYGIEDVKSKESAEACQKIGLGRVVNGKKFI